MAYSGVAIEDKITLILSTLILKMTNLQGLSRDKPCRFQNSLHFREIILPCAADRTLPVIWKILKGCSCRNSCRLISLCRIIHITTDITSILFHTTRCSFCFSFSRFTGVFSMYGTRSGQRPECILTCSTNWTSPVIWKLLELHPFFNLPFPVTLIRVKNIPAVDHLALVHFLR